VRLFIASAGSGTLQMAEPGSSTLRRLATVPRGSGQLAGLAADAQGGVWAALRGGWSVVHFADDGSMGRVVAMPVPSPTALAFGGTAGQTLFITSARDQLGREALDVAPLSGRLFTLQLAEPAGC
jgi:IclR family transcriptional regulator, acetate operon repressor